MNVTFVCAFDTLIDSPVMNLAYGIMLIFGLVITLIFSLSFIYYEHYGGDPMKRSIKVKHILDTFSNTCYSIHVGTIAE